jgi:hypothetical protein
MDDPEKKVQLGTRAHQERGIKHLWVITYALNYNNL